MLPAAARPGAGRPDGEPWRRRWGLEDRRPGRPSGPAVPLRRGAATAGVAAAAGSCAAPRRRRSCGRMPPRAPRASSSEDRGVPGGGQTQTPAPPGGPPPGFRIERSEDEWAEVLGRREYGVLRMRGTEPPTSHRFDRFMPAEGHFACGACGLPLYPAGAKFLSNTGWPAFSSCYHSAEAGGCHVAPQPDRGAHEITCARCGSHLGHVFFDSKKGRNLRGERHCANGLSLTYEGACPEGWELREEGIDMRNAGRPLPGAPRGSCCVM
uniref:MsrB domain-containing protein n=1 Tax=Alexandrium monilatum TaxID=311494 RepID=A0A7S4QLF0_9DINO